MKDERFNALQQVASGISGYEPYKPFSSASDDYYYELKNDDERINHIMSCAAEIYGDILNRVDSGWVNLWLQSEPHLDSCDRFHSFEKLGDYEHYMEGEKCNTSKD